MMLPPDPCRWVPSCSTNTSSSRIRTVSSVVVDGVINGRAGLGCITDPGPTIKFVSIASYSPVYAD